ncbi:MAG: dimethyl sulfoxide reductase anchor subunit [Rhodospirillales bacterium]|nr:dimethyl sulfoxide reductase anchor subunit [Rhodospirillales bacterium]
MRPAYSVIFFTTASGAGYGMLALLGLLAPYGALPESPAFGLAANGLALAFVTAGLLSSTAHLGRPERAWRALSQWRTSWLSREGVAALLAYLPAGLFAALWVFAGRVSPLLGALTALAAVATVTATAMIYRTLKPVQRWANNWVVPNYLALAAMTGALWVLALAATFGPIPRALSVLAAALVLLAAALKLGYWRFIDRSKAASSAESATGLGRFGRVRLLDPPHTEENYLLQEMGYRVARRHAGRLRLLAFLLGFALPLAATLALSAPAPAPGGSGLAGLAALLLFYFGAVSSLIGTLIERWLFFAEAKHTVMLYYGAATA